MPAPYSLDLRQKAISAYEDGEGTQEEITERFSINVSTLRNWLIRKRKTGDIKPKEHIYRGRKVVIGEEGASFIQEMVKEKPDILIKDIQVSYKEKFNIQAAQAMVSRVFKKLDLRRKKKSRHAQEQEREDVKKKEKTGKKR